MFEICYEMLSLDKVKSIKLSQKIATSKINTKHLYWKKESAKSPYFSGRYLHSLKSTRI